MSEAAEPQDCSSTETGIERAALPATAECAEVVHVSESRQAAAIPHTNSGTAGLEAARAAECERRAAKAAGAIAATDGRGQRAKKKKTRDKYAEQDEEDRALALQLLAPAGK